MANKNQESTRIEQDAKSDRRDQLDRELDAALAKYAAVEPRAGLEDRILANLRVERTRVPDYSWRRWRAVVVATVIVVTICILRSGRSTHPTMANYPSVTKPGANESAAGVAPNATGDSRPPQKRPPVRNASKHRPPLNTIVAAAPKLDQFPSPQPLSDQEKLLANYVMQFHRQAAVIARVTNEELQRDRMEVIGNSQPPALTGENADQ